MSAPMHIPPQDLDTERALLGGVLLDNDAFLDVAEHVRPGDFYRPAHGEIFRAMMTLAERREPIDVLTVTSELEATGKAKDAGGLAYVGQLHHHVPGTASIGSYARKLRDLSRRRSLLAAANEIQRLALNPEGTTDEIMDRAGHRILEAVEDRTAKGPEHAQVIVTRVFSNLEQRFERQTDVTGLPTGFEDLDKMTAGWQPGDLIIVAGRPAMGKTGLMMAMAEAAARKAPVLVCEQEMSADSLIERQLASVGRVAGSRIKTGQLLDTDWPKLAQACDRIAKSGLYVMDSGGLTVMAVRAHARRLQMKHGRLGAVFVDYLQLMEAPEADTREQEIATISRGLKSLARELGCPVIVLSQLNRSLERREDKRPVMSDLRESGAIEQDADVVVFVYREEVYDKETNEKGIAELIIGKQRSGAIGTVKVKFIAELTRFESLTDGQWGA